MSTDKDTERKERQSPADVGEVVLSSGDDDLRQYMQEIRRYPLLTAEEERELAIRCARGDEEAIRKMVRSNLRLVVSVAREYAGRGVPLMDLIQEGSIGLLVAAKKFDYTRDYRFSTYATKWIRQGITRCLLNHSGMIRVPVHTAERMRKLSALQAAYRQENGCDPDLDYLSREMGLPEARVRKLLQMTPETCSLDAPVGENDEGTVGQLLPDEEASEPQAELVRAQLQTTMDNLLAQLPQRQQQILRYHFGLEDGECHSLEEIGSRLGVSKERVRQIERQAMDRLQQLGAPLGLEDFLD